ncbi:hypothetical protein NUU61_005716 [Penicillium alfredii]|uniref:Rhamnogalacturonase A/B/Epimerase-like pectate lyase domain-containing protein n=1 Tax=Penicillium alfredii TaxID=1506179 RepID=A0A9W9K833_9EURO|nr:uncharacterized protein NUU61_005716 [Penicillium alfredii]KAJ5096360.1 hypothetical protein NUU61_005716 [Penicillium alfredii]
MVLFSLAIGLAPLLATAQLSGSVGPTTSFSTKSNHKVCNVLDYGSVADNLTDVGPAISSAWNECKEGGIVYIPSGDYAVETWVTLLAAAAHTTDFELFSSTSKGAVQGFGYEFHAKGSLSGARILRLADVSGFSVHDLALVDAPAFHFSLDTCSNGEVYNMAIRGGDSGGLNGIDVWSNNIWIHDVEVTNKGECVTVKAMAMPTPSTSTRNGAVCPKVDGDGVQLNNITTRNWKGTESNGAQRGPIKVSCANGAPCTDLTIEDFAMWVESGDKQTYVCHSAYGSGACLRDEDKHASYSTTVAVTAAPSGYSAATMASDLSSAFGTDSPIPIPAIPTSFYPGVTPYGALAGARSSSA